MKILLLDAAFAAVPIHSYLVGLGHEVMTIGNRDYDPLAVADPARWIKGDYSDVDFVRAAILEHGIERVVPGCTDVSMDTFVRLGPQPDYPYSREADQAINHKATFRALCAELDLPAPRVLRAEDFPVAGRYICKPANSFSGRGVTTVDGQDLAAVSVAIHTARLHSPTGEVVLEEFVEGELHSYSAFVENGKVSRAYVVREGSRYDPFAVDTSYVLADYDAQRSDILRAAVERLSAHLQLCDGLIHTQFINADDRVAILEVTRRCPGDLYSMLIAYSTNEDFAGRFASYFIGVPHEPTQGRQRHVLRHTVKQRGRMFSGFDLEPLQVDGLFRLVPALRAGSALTPDVATRTGVAFLEFPDPAALERRYDALLG